MREDSDSAVSGVDESPAISGSDITRVVRAHRDAEQVLPELLDAIAEMAQALHAMGIDVLGNVQVGTATVRIYERNGRLYADVWYARTLGEKLRIAAEAPRVILDTLLAKAPEEDTARARAVIRAIRDALASEEVQAELAASALGRDAR
jgi:hypothetical protein